MNQTADWREQTLPCKSIKHVVLFNIRKGKQKRQATVKKMSGFIVRPQVAQSGQTGLGSQFPVFSEKFANSCQYSTAFQNSLSIQAHSQVVREIVFSE